MFLESTLPVASYDWPFVGSNGPEVGSSSGSSGIGSPLVAGGAAGVGEDPDLDFSMAAFSFRSFSISAAIFALAFSSAVTLGFGGAASGLTDLVALSRSPFSQGAIPMMEGFLTLA